MKNNVKVLTIVYLLSICLLLSAIYLPGILSPQAQTLDFRGYVEEIQLDEKKQLITINASYINSEAKAEIKASTKISCKYLDGRDFPITNLKQGDMIDLDYKGEWGLNGAGVMQAEAKWLTVCPVN
ncbi:hypothetical protein [Enterococcus sp. LJL51]|uniref:hypothetical protein n=1 Tax=Enterococcus sp. LJL51 TaxID=3416656 RepID=UPI003CF934BB